MAKIQYNNHALIEFIKKNHSLSSKEIHDGLGSAISYATVKRILQQLASEKKQPFPKNKYE